MSPGDARRLAVVVLTWNGRDDTLACLDSLRGAIGPDDTVLVCDNGSSDGTEAAVRERHPWVRFVQNGANLGFAGGHNAGLRRALDEGHRYAMLLNSDTVVPPGAIETLVAYAESHAEAGVVQPALVAHADPSRIDSLELEPLRSFGVRCAGMGLPAAEVPSAPREVFGASGAAALLRSEALRKAGLLDEGFFVMAEDADLAFRVRAAGFAAHLVPAVRVLHKRGISGRPADPRAARLRKLWLQRNTVALAIRYWPTRWIVLFAPLLLWRAAQALWLARGFPEHRCRPLWRGSREVRRTARASLAARGEDRWFR